MIDKRREWGGAFNETEDVWPPPEFGRSTGTCPPDQDPFPENSPGRRPESAGWKGHHKVQDTCTRIRMGMTLL